MQAAPDYPRATNAPDELFDSGHLWLQELLEGAQLRFQVQETGLLRVGADGRAYDDPDAVSLPYQHAVRYVRDNLDRGALRAAVDDVESVVFVGTATRYHDIEYDWDRLPSFLGRDIWSGDRDGFLPPGAVTSIFERLGLSPVTAIERELPARDFHPERFTFPDSAWYDGPVAGVIVRNKRGQRARLVNPAAGSDDETEEIEDEKEENGREPQPRYDPAAVADRFATEDRFGTVAEDLVEAGHPVTFEALSERVLERIVREQYSRLYLGSESVDMNAVRSAIGARTRAFLDDWETP